MEMKTRSIAYMEQHVYLINKMQEPGGEHLLPHAASCTLAPHLYLEPNELIQNILNI